MKIKRQHIFLFGFALLAILGFFLIQQAKATQTSYALATQAQTRRIQAEQAAYMIERGSAELTQLQAQTKKMQAQKLQLDDQVAFSNYLEKICSDQHVQIIALPITNIEQVEAYQLSEERFSLQGSLTSLLNVMHQLEQIDRIGTIRYSRFQKKTIRQKGKEKHLLLLDIILQRLQAHIS